MRQRTEAHTFAFGAATGTAAMTGGVGYYNVEEVVEYFPDGSYTFIGWRAGQDAKLLRSDRNRTAVRVWEDNR